MTDELEALDPDVAGHEMTTGFKIEIVRMQTRQFLRLMKVLTHGAGPRLLSEGLDFEAGLEVFAARLAAIIAMSIPDAENETIDFLQSVCQPAGLAGGIYGKQPSQMSKQEIEGDNALWERFRKEMFNPDPVDTIDIVDILIRREAEDLQALGKKLSAVMKLATRTGQVDESPEAAPEGKDLQQSAPSPGSSTSSATSTGGPTTSSSASPSAGSGRQLKSRARAAASSSGQS